MPTAAKWCLLGGIFLAGTLASLSTGGRDDVGFSSLLGLLHDDVVTQAEQTLIDIRLPRTLTAMLLGLNLGLAGLILQAVTQNSLASPSLLGITQGAALGIVLGMTVPFLTPLPDWSLAASFGMGAAVLAFAIAGLFSGRIDSMRLILGGVAVGSVGFAAVRLGYTLEDDLARDVVRWTAGDISDLRFSAVQRLVLFSAPGLFLSSMLAHRLNLLAVGHATSHSLGADPRRTLYQGAAIASVLTGASVSVAGPIAFVGLVVPHLARRLGGMDHRRLVPVAAFVGATLMLWADTLSKILPQTEEVPVGIIVAVIGAPWFLACVLRRTATTNGP
jgi:iron complex transport system permease protein